MSKRGLWRLWPQCRTTSDPHTVPSRRDRTPMFHLDVRYWKREFAVCTRPLPNLRLGSQKRPPIGSGLTRWLPDTARNIERRCRTQNMYEAKACFASLSRRDGIGAGDNYRSLRHPFAPKYSAAVIGPSAINVAGPSTANTVRGSCRGLAKTRPTARPGSRGISMR